MPCTRGRIQCDGYRTKQRPASTLATVWWRAVAAPCAIWGAEVVHSMLSSGPPGSLTHQFMALPPNAPRCPLRKHR